MPRYQVIVDADVPLPRPTNCWRVGENGEKEWLPFAAYWQERDGKLIAVFPDRYTAALALGLAVHIRENGNRKG
jgi:hypothetical protein